LLAVCSACCVLAKCSCQSSCQRAVTRTVPQRAADSRRWPFEGSGHNRTRALLVIDNRTLGLSEFDGPLACRPGFKGSSRRPTKRSCHLASQGAQGEKNWSSPPLRCLALLVAGSSPTRQPVCVVRRKAAIARARSFRKWGCVEKHRNTRFRRR
jgi:hypothetical protein